MQLSSSLKYVNTDGFFFVGEAYIFAYNSHYVTMPMVRFFSRFIRSTDVTKLHFASFNHATQIQLLDYYLIFY